MLRHNGITNTQTVNITFRLKTICTIMRLTMAATVNTDYTLHKITNNN